MPNTLVFHTLEKEKKIYTLTDADKIITAGDVLKLPRTIYYQDAKTRKVICYKLRQCCLPYSVDEANNCIRR